MAVELCERAEREVKVYGRSNENGRQPKTFLREEIRGIINRDTTKWGKELKEATEGSGEGVIWNIVRNGDHDELGRRFRRVVQMKADEVIQGDWNKIGNLEFSEDDKYLKENTGDEKYWED